MRSSSPAPSPASTVRAGLGTRVHLRVLRRVPAPLLYHAGGDVREDGSPTLSMKAGTLDDTSAVAPTSHLWTKRAQPWLAPVLNGAVCYETEPDSEEALRRGGETPAEPAPSDHNGRMDEKDDTASTAELLFDVKQALRKARPFFPVRGMAAGDDSSNSSPRPWWSTLGVPGAVRPLPPPAPQRGNEGRRRSRRTEAREVTPMCGRIRRT